MTTGDGPGLGVDVPLTREFLDQVVETAGRVGGVDCTPYVASVEQRLAVGAARYGPEAWRDRDNLRELREETPDVACYSLFEWLRDLEDAHHDGNRTHHLFMAAVYGALADWHARAAHRG